MKCQNLLFGKIKKKKFNMSSVEIFTKVQSVKTICYLHSAKPTIKIVYGHAFAFVNISVLYFSFDNSIQGCTFRCDFNFLSIAFLIFFLSRKSAIRCYIEYNNILASALLSDVASALCYYHYYCYYY